MDVRIVPSKMVLILACLPADFFAMRYVTLGWVRYKQSEIVEVKAAFTKTAAGVKTWPIGCRPIAFAGKSSHVLEHVLGESTVVVCSGLSTDGGLEFQ